MSNLNNSNYNNIDFESVKVNLDERNKFIKQYLPFIISSVSEITNRYVETENSDEYIIGLESFNEAIESFNEKKGNFFSYAKLVLKSRLIDYKRKNDKHVDHISLEELDFELKDMTDTEFMTDIKIFQTKLNDFGIDFENLVEASPKHIITKIEIDDLSLKLTKDIEIVETIFKTKKMPMKEISLRYKISKKRLVSYRDYIISILVIFNYKLDTIKEFIDIKEVSGIYKEDENE